VLAATNSKALWYATRSTGMVSLVLLTLSVALGVAQVVRLASPAWPRFVIAALHRNASLLAVVFLGVHIATAVADSFAPIRLVDVFVPFVGSYRPLWLGLGTVAFDLMLAVVITSLLRERIGHGVWRAVHWASYAAWPVALLHGLGTGSDTRERWAVVVNLVCLGIVLAAVLSRVGWTRSAAGGRRVLIAFTSVAVAVGVTTWMVLEPMRPGWARKAGTPTALIASTDGAPVTVTGIPIPFSSATRGSIRQTSSATTGLTTVTIDARLTSVPQARLHVTVEGTALPDGGVSMQDGHVSLGVAGAPNLYSGAVVSLNGSTVGASVRGPKGAVALSMQFSVDATSNVVGGTVSARRGAE
jgi:hypothetical protein